MSGEIKHALQGKMLVRVDKEEMPNEPLPTTKYTVVYVIPEKALPGHIEIKIQHSDISGLKELKGTLQKMCDVAIVGYNNWKQVIDKL